MRVISVAEAISSVEVTADEVILPINALNEALHGIPLPEFQTRLGADELIAKHLMHQLQKLTDKISL